ncbi:hypothetical protein AB835_11890 [Candidatus Endobugula sertula]|uniref:Uncharacterized protein n=1 Tax=Candidatus Endobugula sertula TaxID=62101 RepID=A0A1D2QMQ4_9GAMM|nr:hypothetical protein AB835_11890 [Candidatus Endobugula sertula]
MNNQQWQLNRQGEYIRVGVDGNANKIDIVGFSLSNGGFQYELPMGNHVEKNFHKISLKDYPQENSLLLRFYYPG